MGRQETFSLAVILFAVLAGAEAFSQTPPAYTEGQQVEVREGDEWSPVTIQKREGRRYQVRYADGTEEWVATDRLRVPAGKSPAPAAKGAAPVAGATASPAAAPSSAAAPKTSAPVPAASKAPVGPTWQVEDKVDCKCAFDWRSAVVKEIRDGWCLVSYGVGADCEWVEPWRLRKPGDTSYELRYCKAGELVALGSPPPSRPPGPLPAGIQVVAKAPSPTAAADAKSAEGAAIRSSAVPAPAAAAESDRSAEEKRSAVPRVAAAGGQFLPLSSAVGAWSLSLDPLPPSKAGSSGSVSQVPLKIPAGDDASAQQMVFAAGAPVVAVSFHGSDQTPLTVQRIADGELSGTWKFAGELSLASISPDGKLVAMRAEQKGDSNERIEVWSIGESVAKQQLTFFPHGNKNNNARVACVMLLGEQRLLTTTPAGELAIWDTATGRPLKHANILAGCAPAVSPGGKYLAVTNDLGLQIFTATDGKVVASAKGNIARATRLSFNESCTWLVASDGWNIWAIDLRTGEVKPEFMVARQTAAFSSIRAFGDGLVLVNDNTVVDLQTRLAFMKYETPERGLLAGGSDGRLWYLLNTDRPVLYSTDSAPPEQVKRARTLDPEAVLVLKPGAGITVAVTVKATSEEQWKIRGRLEDASAASGLKVADAQPLRLVAMTVAGKPEQHSYRPLRTGGPPRDWPPSGPPSERPFSGMYGPVEVLTYTPYTSRLRLEYAGKVVWEVTAQSQMAFLFRPGTNQTRQEALDAGSGPNLEMFSRTPIPSRLAQAPSADFLQYFRVNAMGAIKTAPPPSAQETPEAAEDGGGVQL